MLFLWIPCIHLFLAFIFITKLALSATFNKAEARDSCSYYTVLRLSWPMSGLPDKATPFSTCHQPGPTWELVRRPWLKCLPFSLICISNPNTWHILISRSTGLAGPQPSPAHRRGWFITPSAGVINQGNPLPKWTHNVFLLHHIPSAPSSVPLVKTQELRKSNICPLSSTGIGKR